MKKYLRCVGKERLKAITNLICALLLAGAFLLIEDRHQKAEAERNQELNPSELAIFQENSLSGASSPENPERVARGINALITGYSSTHWETDDTPFITASGGDVKDGIVANNLLPFGTRIKIPGIYGDKIFVVEDRMNKRVGYYCFDIWFSSRQEALNFGAKSTYIEILEG